MEFTIRSTCLAKDTPKFRTIKCGIGTNVLGVCSQDMEFIFVLLGWEGTADSRVLRDVIDREDMFMIAGE